MASTPVQSTYSERISAPPAGAIGGSDFNTKTGTCEEANGIAFGLPVKQGSADKGVLKAGALALFLGISVRDITLGAEQDHYAQYQNMGYVSQGQVWVTASVAVSADDPVHYDATSGAWTISGGSGPIVGARYVTSGAAGDRVLVELQAR